MVTGAFVAVDGVAAGLIVISDPVKAESAAAVRDLDAAGIEAWLVTGDGDGLSIGGNHLLHLLRRPHGALIQRNIDRPRRSTIQVDNLFPMDSVGFAVHY